MFRRGRHLQPLTKSKKEGRINLDGIGGSTGDRAIVLDFTCACVVLPHSLLAGPPHEEINIHITYLLNVREYKEYSVWRRARDDLSFINVSSFPSTATRPCQFNGSPCWSCSICPSPSLCQPARNPWWGKHSRWFLFSLLLGYCLECRLILRPSKKVRVNFPFCFGAWLDLQYYPTKLCVVGRIYKVHYFWSATSSRWSRGFSVR